MPEYRSDMTVKLVQHLGDETMIMNAAKISTLAGASFDESAEQKDPARFVKWLMREKHGSPFEHNLLTFYLEVPIFVSRQIVKYRHTSLNEVSGRYSVLEGTFYVPDDYRPLVQIGKTGDYQFEQGTDYQRETTWLATRNAALMCWDQYQLMLEDGIAKEVARMVLPVNTYSQMVVTANLRTWLHFVAQRASEAPSHGQYEIAMVADQVGLYIQELFPNVWQEFVEGGYQRV